VSKYRNIATVYDGERYDSRGEAEYARTLDLQKAVGAITDWRRGTVWTLLPGARRTDRIEYRPDFEVWDAAGGLRAVDFKGVETPVFKLKAKLWRAVYPDVALYVVKADGSERRV